MSSYDSNKLGHTPTQYQQPPPPYPTTPGPPSQSPNYFPPIPEQQPIHSPSPNQPTSPYATMQEANLGRRRTSSSSSYNPQTQPQPQSMPVPIRQPDPHQYQHPASYPPSVSYAQQTPVYARSTSQQSHYSQHGEHTHHPHAYADGEDKYEHRHHHQHQQQHGGLDPETEREYKRRYAKDKDFERRPTLGGSLLSMVDKVGKAFGSERH